MELQNLRTEEERLIWLSSGQIIKGLTTVIQVEITPEDLRENGGTGRRIKKPIVQAANRIFGFADIWGAWRHLWFRWTEADGAKCCWQYECKEEDIQSFLANPSPCTLRFERIK